MRGSRPHSCFLALVDGRARAVAFLALHLVHGSTGADPTMGRTAKGAISLGWSFWPDAGHHPPSSPSKRLGRAGIRFGHRVGGAVLLGAPLAPRMNGRTAAPLVPTACQGGHPAMGSIWISSSSSG